MTYSEQRADNGMQAQAVQHRSLSTTRRLSAEDEDEGKRLKPLNRPSWLREEVWPFRISGLEVDCRTIAVTDVGRGPVLLFAHTGFWSFIWRDVIRRLSSDFRCVCFDSPGTGLSDRVPGENLSLENASSAVTAIIEALDLKNLTLVIHDLGGVVGLAGAAKFPERVKGIAAVNTFAWKPSDPKLRMMLALIGSPAMREFDVVTQLIPRITTTSFGVGRRLDLASRSVFRSGIGREGIRAFHYYMRDARRCDQLYEKVGAALNGPFRNLPLITIFGERNDPFGFQLRWKALYPDARQMVIRKGDHFPMCDEPELVADTLRNWHRAHVIPDSGLSAE